MKLSIDTQMTNADAFDLGYRHGVKFVPPDMPNFATDSLERAYLEGRRYGASCRATVFTANH